MRDSIRINNWLTFVSIIIISVTLVLYSKYIAPEQQRKAALKKIPSCQIESSESQKTVCFDKLYNKYKIKEAFELLGQGDYELNGGIILSEQSPSTLEKYISLNHTDKYFLDQIDTKQNKESIRRLNINYEIIENDKINLDKKSDVNSCEKFAGYILASFRINNKQLYRIQIGFHSVDKNEIKKRIECIMESFIHYAS